MITYTYIVKRVEKKLEGFTPKQQQRQPAGMIHPQDQKQHKTAQQAQG